MGRHHSFVRYWLPVILLCLAIFVQSSFPSTVKMLPWPQGDKFMHAAVYGILAALFFRAFNAVGSWRQKPARTLLFSMMATGLYGLSDEWHQSFVAGRTADAVDWIADKMGAALACGLYLTILLRNRKTGHT